MGVSEATQKENRIYSQRKTEKMRRKRQIKQLYQHSRKLFTCLWMARKSLPRDLRDVHKFISCFENITGLAV